MAARDELAHASSWTWLSAVLVLKQQLAGSAIQQATAGTEQGGTLPDRRLFVAIVGHSALYRFVLRQRARAPGPPVWAAPRSRCHSLAARAAARAAL